MDHPSTLNIVMPFRGEFGMKLINHVPAVHALTCENKIVVCEPGEESLYPGAKDFIFCERRQDELRRDSTANDQQLLHRLEYQLETAYGKGLKMIYTRNDMPKKYFRPEPYTLVDPGGPIDVVICPRKREYGAEKNWPHWKALSGRLVEKLGLRVFAIGAPDSSDTGLHPGCRNSWEHARFLDMSLAALHSARLVIATDAGLANLAVWCGKPLLMISYENGIVAPGPVRENHIVMREHYWAIDRTRYRQQNHLGSPINIVPYSWHNLDLLEEKACEMLGLHKTA